MNISNNRRAKTRTNRPQSDHKSDKKFFIICIAIACLISAICIVTSFLTSRLSLEQEMYYSDATLEVSDVLLPDTFFFNDENKTVYVLQDTTIYSSPDIQATDIVTTSIPKYTELLLIGINDYDYWKIKYEDKNWYINKTDITDDDAVIAEFQKEEQKENMLNEISSGNASNIIVLGDSRTVGMDISVNSNVTFIGKVSSGYKWMTSTAIPQAETQMNDNTICIFNFGVNDIDNVNRYISALNDFKSRHPNNIICFMTVNPVDEQKERQNGYSVSNSSIANFNAKMKQGLSNDIIVIDSYQHLIDNGFSTVDGIHYTTSTYNDIYNYMLNNIVQ